MANDKTKQIKKLKIKGKGMTKPGNVKRLRELKEKKAKLDLIKKLRREKAERLELEQQQRKKERREKELMKIENEKKGEVVQTISLKKLEMKREDKYESSQKKASYEVSYDSSDEYEESWLTEFLSSNSQYKALVRIPSGYFRDAFNLTGLDVKIPYYHDVIKMIRNEENTDNVSLQRSAAVCYALVHQRFCLSSHGLSQAEKLYHKGVFGTCPNLSCEDSHVLPVGISDEPGVSSLHVYCPRCHKTYKSSTFSSMDGCFYGTTFPHMFGLVYPEIFIHEPPISHCPLVFGMGVAKKSDIDRVEAKMKERAEKGIEIPLEMIQLFKYTDKTK
ncbi:Casein kinase II, regulatory subunit like protein [Aduncisulcus paluster]|uniref:Casein kinase II subunit beta n=1 Tax=Aduncisulcus paluster TaxID=2918883 RepID=A0ABQ5JQM3_9EUKA|nr:Casein kinase II, regulatory subunit like protein [Aduncisulcus paluster]